MTTQWLILASLWLYFRKRTEGVAFWPWLVLVSISALVHPYLCAMVVSISLACYLRLYVNQAASRRTIFAQVTTLCASCIFWWWSSGAFVIKVRSGFDLREYGANLLTWFNPSSFSDFLPNMQIAGDRYEGFGYLGLGVLILLSIAIGVRVFSLKERPIPWRDFAPLLLAISLMTLFAFSTRLTLGTTVLADFTPGNMPILGAFRASGRFIWPSVYGITLFAVVTTSSKQLRYGAVLLSTAFVIQLLDLSPLRNAYAHMREGNFAVKEANVLNDEQWREVLSARKHIVLFPPAGCGQEAGPYFPFALLAADHGLTINTGYLARYDGIQREKYCVDLNNGIDRGERDPAALYIVGTDVMNRFAATSGSNVRCQVIEGYSACETTATADKKRTTIDEDHIVPQ